MRLRRLGYGITRPRDPPANKAKQQLWSTPEGQPLGAAFGAAGARLPRTAEERKFPAHTTYQLMRPRVLLQHHLQQLADRRLFRFAADSTASSPAASTSSSSTSKSKKHTSGGSS